MEKTQIKDQEEFAKNQFKKNNSQKEKESVTLSNNKDEHPYIIQLYDVEGTTIFERSPFGAKRYIEKANVYLFNEKVGFKEPFPTNSDEFKNYRIDEAERRIRELTNQLNSLRNHNKSSHRITAEELDLTNAIKTFKNFKRSLELQGEGSYMTVSTSGKPIYSFFRKGNFKLPLFNNVDTSLRYVPNEAAIAEASELLKLNDDKNGKNDHMHKVINIILSVVLLLGVIGLAIILYKAGTMPEAMVNSMTQLADSNTQLAEKFSHNLDKIQNVTDRLTRSSPRPSVIPAQVNVTN
jgi:hypothetical protein